MDNSKHIVISLGGSLIVPDSVDTYFVISFKKCIERLITEEGYRFTLFAGGGSVCRLYNDALDIVDSTKTREDKDWLGISITKVNALFLKTVFGDLAHDTIVTDPNIIPDTSKPIIIGAGWKPGWSTDYDSVLYAKNIGVSHVINLSNISHVYTKDPRKHNDAVKIERTTWEDYRKIIPDSWEAGLHSPFDPIASRLAQEVGITVSILDGRNIDEFENVIHGKPFEGTNITP
jgi:uridylate kinase